MPPGRHGRWYSANIASGGSRVPLVLLALSQHLLAPDAHAPRPEWQTWRDVRVPPGSPFEKSRELVGWEFVDHAYNVVGTGTAAAGGADTWYPSWAAGGDLFTPWTDGTVNDSTTKLLVSSSSCGPCRGNNGSNVTQGFACVPAAGTAKARNLQVTDVGTVENSALPFQGRYPSANLYYKGVWYYGTYSVAEVDGNLQYELQYTCHIFSEFRETSDRIWNLCLSCQ